MAKATKPKKPVKKPVVNPNSETVKPLVDGGCPPGYYLNSKGVCVKDVG